MVAPLAPVEAAPRERPPALRDLFDVDAEVAEPSRAISRRLQVRSEHSLTQKRVEEFDAERRFDVGAMETLEPAACISGQILRGLKKPHDCPAFGSACTPERPLGATMVSAEGACAAYFAYGRHRQEATR